MSKRSFAQKMDVSQEYVRFIEKGIKPPSLKFCLACAVEFGINPQWVKNKWLKDTVERIKQNLEMKLGLIQTG